MDTNTEHKYLDFTIVNGEGVEGSLSSRTNMIHHKYKPIDETKFNEKQKSLFFTLS